MFPLQSYHETNRLCNMNRRSAMIAMVLLAGAFVSSIPTARASDFPVTSTSRSDFISSGNNYGSAVSESKISTDPAYQSQSAVYGPNNPIMYAGLMAELVNSNIPFFLYSLKVTVRITNSAGQTLQPINVGNLGMNISPNDSSSTTDWGQIFTELYNYVTSVIGLPQFPTLQNPAPVNTSGCQSSATGVGCDSAT